MTLFAAKSATVECRGGINLGIVEYGPRGGHALFYFHGFPGSRLEAYALAAPVERLGIRLIGIDRPGMGLSTFQPRRRVLDWPDDVAALADALAIDRFSVVGCSGGGPYALACARKIPDRVAACGIVSGMGVPGPLLALAARGLPRLLAPMLRPWVKSERRAARWLPFFDWCWPAADKKVLSVPEVRETVAASLAEAFRQGSKGPVDDAALLGGSWGFALEEIRHPALYLWHGEQDRVIPIAMARRVATKLQGCEAVYEPDEGHISLIVNQRDRIVETLLSRR